MTFSQLFSLAALFALFLNGSVSVAFADELTLESKPSEIETWGKIISSRESLDQALAIDTTLLSLSELEAAKKHATGQASQLQRMATDFTDEFVLSTNLLRAFEHAAYALGVEGVLKGQAALAGVVNNITGVEWGTQFVKNAPTLNGQEETIRGVIETNLVSGAIAALRFRPTNNLVFTTLLELAQRATGDAGKPLARELATNSLLPATYMDFAKNILDRQYSIGQPFALTFSAIDGRNVDLAHLRGKVVLVNFWGTDCVPCIAEFPELKSIYKQYQDRGFEIVGISLDHEAKPVLRVIREKEIPWPIILDDGGWKNGLAAKCGIFGIPNNWLVDRKGTLREVAARENIGKKVEVLLAEPD